tara:strand:- start:510 stop:1565 length:1056 start_codon:yes stop_codon:yes gene_type:complete
MEVNLTAPINDLGYGVAGLNILKGLVRNGCKVSYWPIGQPTAHTEEDAEIIRACMSNRELFNKDAPSLRLWHQHDMAEHIGAGIRVGFPVFELDTFSDVEKHHLSSLDKIIVCSHWAKQVVEKEIPNSHVYVAPLGVDRSIFTAQEPEHKETTVLLNIGKWEIRKGHDVLVEAFNKAFTIEDDVELWMMNNNPFLTEEQESEWHRLYLNSPLGRKIKIMPRVNSHAEVAQVMRQSDVGVFPSRAEGWNLEALEMMSMGKQVILTNYSAHTEFATNQNSELIEIDETELAYDGIWFHGQGKWATIAEPQVNQLVESMKKCYEKKRKINENGISTSDKFSWSYSAKQIMEALA